MPQKGAAAVRTIQGGGANAAIVIFSTDPVLRHSLERRLSEDPMITVAGVVDDREALLRLTKQDRPDVVLTDVKSFERWAELGEAQDGPLFVVLVDDAGEENKHLLAKPGARAVLARTAAGSEIVAAINAVAGGYVTLPYELFATLFPGASVSEGSQDGERARLTQREHEVLTAMADGISNKAIARRLGISVHTAKFHVAAILSKLDADSRTEAVAKAAQRGLVML
jgi:DNA-binding NarL/FixJ family response regulator